MIYWMSLAPLIINVLLGYVILMQIKQVSALEKKLQNIQMTLTPIMQEHRVIMKADVDIEHKIQDIYKQLISMDNQIQSLENVRANDGGYQHALHILEMGGTKEEIVTSCHLSNAEAELLMNLQAYRTALTHN